MTLVEGAVDKTPHVTRAREQAAWLVVTNWRRIESLAAALLERGPPSGNDVRVVIRGSLF